MGFQPADKPGVEVRCMLCGHVFPQDPIFEVKCPTCQALPGQYCRRPSGHQGPFVDVHTTRDLLADKMGHYTHECVETTLEVPGKRKPKPVDPRQQKLF